MRRFLACFLGIVGTSLLCSCSTTGSGPGATGAFHEPVYKFTVLRYKQPVAVNNWVPDAALASDAEGAAMNIVHLMQQGAVSQWLECWLPADRPSISTEDDRQAFLRRWLACKDSSVKLLGRTIANLDIIVEVALTNPQGQTELLQLPLAKTDGTWRMVNLPADSEYLHWESSANKIVSYVDPESFAKRMQAARGQFFGVAQR